jgi:hypothetical protein
MIGGLSRTATAALRQLLDAGTLSNLPAGFKQRGVRVRDEASPIQPGEFKDVDAPGGSLRDAFFPLPYNAYRKMYEAIGVKDISQILPPPAPIQPIDPSVEHINAMAGKPFQAFPGQDHRAHITAHLNFMSTNMVRNNPMIMAAVQKNILEHISIMAQEQVQLEFREQMMQMQMLQQQAPTNPQAAQQLQQLMQVVEARKAVLIAEMTEDYMREEKKITSQFDSDPLLKLKSREVDLRAMENERKKQNDEAQVELARARLMQSRENFEDKLEQNEDLSKLRAGVSLAKSGIDQAKVMIED